MVFYEKKSKAHGIFMALRGTGGDSVHHLYGSAHIKRIPTVVVSTQHI
jgi:hypothetical protein